MFASNSIVEHLGRGALGLAALGVAVHFAASYPWVALVAVPIALVALRGCPTCWTIGLVETLTARTLGRAAPETCRDGACTRRSSGSSDG